MFEEFGDTVCRVRSRWFFLGGAMACFGSLSCGSVASSLLLFPPKPEPSFPAQRVMLGDQGGAIETIRARSVSEREATAVVLRFFGNAAQASAHVAEEARTFADWPIDLWGVNYPGYGQSEGSASLSGVVRAADVAFAAAEKTGLPVYVVGTSMGTTAALHLGATRKVAGIVLINPPPLRQLICGEYGWWNLWLLAGPISLGVPSELDSIANAERTKTKVAVITSADDTLVPLNYQEKVYAALAGEKMRFLIPGAGHNDPVPADLWKKAVAEVRRSVSLSRPE
jgi:uncharacterized protein